MHSELVRLISLAYLLCGSTIVVSARKVLREQVAFIADTGLDDSLGLMAALSNPNLVEIVAIVCTYGNVDIADTCANARRVLALFHNDEIPVYEGSSKPLVRPRAVTDHVYGQDGLGDQAAEFPTGVHPVQDDPGVLALVSLSNQYPHKLTVVNLGPMTTLALAHMADPRFTQRLKSIVFMGGNYRGIGNISPVAEFNFYLDPEVANIVVSEAACPMVCIPWETCLTNGFTRSEYEQLVQVDTHKGYFFKKITADFANTNFNLRGKLQFAVPDLLAVSFLLYPSSATSAFQSPMTVDQSELTKGLVLRERRYLQSQNVCVETDFDRDFVYGLLMNVLQD